MVTGQAREVQLQLENVAIIRGGRLVIQGLSLQALAGDIIWLRGANGSGKSTLLRCLAGLLPTASGQRRLTGSIALADDNISVDRDLPLEKALALWAKMDGASAEQQHASLTAFGLSGLAEVPVSYLSTGQRKRAALARILNSAAQIWLLDEPYNGLDSANGGALDQKLTRHAQAGGIAVVAEHRPPSINVAATISLDQPKKAQTQASPAGAAI